MNLIWTKADRHWQLDLGSGNIDHSVVFDAIKEKSGDNILINLLNLSDEQRFSFVVGLKNALPNQDRILIVAGILDDESWIEWAPTLSEARDLMFMAILEKELSEE